MICAKSTTDKIWFQTSVATGKYISILTIKANCSACGPVGGAGSRSISILAGKAAGFTFVEKCVHTSLRT